MLWKFRNRRFDLSTRGLIVGIVNATPDSFSDGGAYLDPEAASAHGLRLLEGGADLLDVGGESTRPGAAPVSEEEELRRVIPVIEALRRATDAPISIDTSKASVAEAALAAGADIINDVTALEGDPRMGAVAAASGAGVILMHMRGTPLTMQQSPSYSDDDVARAVAKYLSGRRDAALGFGVDASAIILDPGLGFGKTAAHNLELIRSLSELCGLGAPVLIGHSRKSFLGSISGEVQRDNQTAGDQRLHAGIAVTVLARRLGARLFRVHDAAPHRAALRATEAILNTGGAL
jgi:dihydropteroate synthase